MVLSRRSILAGGAALAAASAAPGTAPSATERPARPPIVLVHGAWHGGWCWEVVAREVAGLGHAVYTPTLAGLGERAGELDAPIGLETHIADISELFRRENLADAVLVGHSYAGMVITAIAERFRSAISHVVYLDAALPEDGDTMLSYGPGRTPADIEEARTTLAAMAANGTAIPPPPPETFGIPMDHPRYQWVARRLSPHPPQTWLDPVRLVDGGSGGLPRTYVHCTDPVLGRTNFPAIARLAARDPSWRYCELATGHDAMVTAPREVVRIVLDAAASRGA